MRRIHTTDVLRRTAVTTALILSAAGLAGHTPLRTRAGFDAGLGLGPGVRVRARRPPSRLPWFTSWAQSQERLAAKPVSNQSLRVITHLSQGGSALRIRIQNTFGTAPLTVDNATVGISRNDASITGRTRAVTFAGRPAVTIPAGGEIWSDAARLVTRAQDDVAVSAYVSGTATPASTAPGCATTTSHRRARATTPPISPATRTHNGWAPPTW
ncbi:hypothetical protein NKH18_18990 [Streptomyces sp. M10(2022)]